MRIDLLLDSRQYGGIEAHVYELAKALVARGHEAEVVFIRHYGDHPLKNQLALANIPYCELNRSSLQAIKALAERKPDVIHTHGYKAGILGRVAGVLGHIGVCSSYHSGETKHGKLALYTWLDELTAPLAQEIIAVSHKIAQQLPSRTHVINNFVESNHSLSDGEQIAFVGRLSYEKGPDRLIKAAKLLPSYQFHLYGDGPMANNLQKSASQNMVFHGTQPMAQHWSKIGVLVMPSRYEGLPLAALEAMSHGIPVIASNAGDLSRLISHQKNGWILEGDAHNDITGELMKTIVHWKNLNTQEKRTLQCNAQTTINKKFSAQKVVPQFLDCYVKAATSIYHAN